MVCPECGGKTEVTHNRSFPDYIWRRRVCKQCEYVMTTYEIIKPQEERYPMGRPKRTIKSKRTESGQVCRYNYGVSCDGTKKCSKCGWNPKKRG